MRQKDFFSIAVVDTVFVAAGAAVGLAALLLVHLLPVEPIREHIYGSLGMIEKEFTDEKIVEGFEATLTGNFTDCIMLEHAVYESEDHSLLEQALHMYRGETCSTEEWWPGYSLKDYLEGVPQPREVDYARYWHGYLLILKPLLSVTSVNTIRLLNSAMQLFAVGCVVIGFCKKKEYLLAEGFLISIPFLYFISTYASLSLSVCLYIMLIGIGIQLRFDDVLKKKNIYHIFFLAIGMATAYFDFLTYPLITLTYPLCVYLYLHDRGLAGNVRKMICYSVQWLGGYLGLWASKWILTDLLTGNSTIKDALGTLMVRTHSAEGYSRSGGFLWVVIKNIKAYGNWCYVILAIIMLLIIVRRISAVQPSRGISFFLVMLYPFVWFFVTQNHSEQHWQFTCRILAGGVFAGFMGCLKCFGADRGPDKDI